MTTEGVLQAMNDAQEAVNQVSSTYSGALGQPWSAPLVEYLSASVLVFMAIAFVLCTALLWRRKADALEILKVFGILSIVGLSALLLITGYSNDQLTPIVGLFGAIAGYLLGKESSSCPKAASEPLLTQPLPDNEKEFRKDYSSQPRR